jgi:hypothetical protein
MSCPSGNPGNDRARACLLAGQLQKSKVRPLIVAFDPKIGEHKVVRYLVGPPGGQK